MVGSGGGKQLALFAFGVKGAYGCKRSCLSSVTVAPLLCLTLSLTASASFEQLTAAADTAASTSADNGVLLWLSISLTAGTSSVFSSPPPPAHSLLKYF